MGVGGEWEGEDCRTLPFPSLTELFLTALHHPPIPQRKETTQTFWRKVLKELGRAPSNDRAESGARAGLGRAEQGLTWAVGVLKGP